MQERDHRIRDLGLMTLILRPDLVFAPRNMGQEPCYVVEDAVNSKYYSIGIPEYTFISCLDGQTTVAQALSLTAQALPEQALTEADAATICQWLIESELAFTATSVESKRLAQAAKDKKPAGLATCNPLYMKVPLCFPDRFFAKMVPWLGWLYGKPMFAVTLVLMLLGTYQVFANWTRFVIASKGVFAPGQWMWLGLCWVVLKIVHECSHGAVCKKYGGSVREAGLIFILFAPLAYVDVTSSWRFKSKLHRIFTAAAGMYVELLIASVAALIWAGTQPGIVNNLCFHIVLMASVTTLVFNANPLMRFDGYYLLSDAVDIPNLYPDGQLFLRYLGRKYVLGLPAELSTGSWSRDTFIRMYGIAAFFWRTSVTFFLILAAATMFEGAGIVIALLATAIWLAIPALKFAAYLIRGNAWEKPNRLRFAGVVLPGALLAFYVLTHTPWPGVKRTPAVVEYSPLAVVRALTPGFVDQMHVRSGQRVNAGQLIATLRNAEVRSELRDVEVAIEQSELECRALKQREELAAYQAEQKQLESLRKKQQEKRNEVAQLSVRAPISGTIIVRDPAALLGTYATRGAEIVSIGDEQRKELRMSIRQEDLDDFVACQGKPISARLPGGVRLASLLTRIPPQASLQPPHVSLSAPYGGPLEVRTKDASDTGNSQDKFELLTPGFTGIVTLSASASSQLRVGQRGIVWLPRGQETIARHLWKTLQSSIPDRFVRQFNLAP